MGPIDVHQSFIVLYIGDKKKFKPLKSVGLQKFTVYQPLPFTIIRSKAYLTVTVSNISS